MSFTVNFATKWSDFDPNFHMRHTAYNDYAAEVRIRFFTANNFSMDDFKKHNVGAILFKEETIFKKEIHMGEDISVNLKLEGVSAKNERWKFVQEVFNKDGELSATIRVYGAWIDTIKRKLTVPPKETGQLFLAVEKSDDFKEIPLK